MSKFENVPTPTGFDVYWEPWVDAYDNDDLDRAKAMFEQQIEQHFDDSDGEYEPEQEEEMMMEMDLAMFDKPIKTIITPFGVLPLTENSLASNHFKFWIGHTNFKILNSHLKIIEACDGIESIDILTPYRFRVSIGKLFVDRDVMYNLRNILVEHAT